MGGGHVGNFPSAPSPIPVLSSPISALMSHLFCFFFFIHLLIFALLLVCMSLFLSLFSIHSHGPLCIGSSRVERDWLKTRKPSVSLCWVPHCSLEASPSDLVLGTAWLWPFCGPGQVCTWSRPGLQSVSLFHSATIAFCWRGVEWHHWACHKVLPSNGLSHTFLGFAFPHHSS